MNKSGKLIPIFLLIGVIAAAILRFFQYVSILDYSNGFFVSGSEFAGVLIYILMGIIAAIFIVLAIIGKKRGEAAYTVSSDGMGCHATQILGISELAAAFILIIRLYEGYSTLRIVCTSAVVICLLISGFMQLKNTVPPVLTGHLKIACSLLLYPIIAELYESDLILFRRSDKLIVILSYVAICMFLAALARFYSRLETRNSRVREIIISGIAFILCSSHTLPKILAYAFGGSAVTGMAGIDLLVTAGMILSGAFLGTLYFTSKSKDIIPVLYEEEEEKLREEEKKKASE